MAGPLGPAHALVRTVEGAVPVKGILNFTGMTIGGWIGWAIGKPVSLYTAFIISFVGTGVGLYAAIKVTKALVP